LYAKEDYERQLQEYDTEATKIQSQINALALDDSAEAMAKKVALQQQLDEILTKKQDTIRDQNRKSEKDMYQDLLNLKKDYIDDLKDEEDNFYKTNKDNLEKQLDDYAIKCQVELELATELTSNIARKYEEMAKRIGGVYDSLIEKIKTFNSISTAKSMVNDSGASSDKGFTTFKHEYGMSDTDYYLLLANGQRWAELNAKGYNNNNSAECRALHEENERIRKKYGIPTGVYPRYANGGLVDYTGIGFLDGSKTNPEYVLKSVDFKMLRETIDLMKTFMPKVNTPNLSNIKTGNQIAIDKIETHVYAANGMNEEKLASLIENQVWNNFSKRLVLGGI